MRFLFFETMFEKAIAWKKRAVQIERTEYWANEQINRSVWEINWGFGQVTNCCW